MKSLRVFLIDDHVPVRTQVRRLLGQEAGFEVIGEGANGEPAVEQMLTDPPNIVLIDPGPDDEEGFSIMRRISAELPQTAIIVLAAVVDTAMRMKLQKMGIGQIMSKEISRKGLIGTLRDLLM